MRRSQIPIITCVVMLLLLCNSASFAAAPLKTTISGIHGEALENATKRSEKVVKQHDHAQSSAEVRQITDQISFEIKESLKPFGYFQANVRPYFKQDKNQWQAHFEVTPGPRITVHQIKLRLTGAGRTDPSFHRLIQHFPIRRGQPLNTPRYEQAKADLLNLAAARGYFDAKMVDSNITVDLAHNQATIRIHLDTGPRYRFGRVRFIQINNGAKRLSERFLQRFVAFTPGSPFNHQQLFELQERLQASHYFSQVNITPYPHQAHKLYVPIDITLTASKAKSYTFGAGVGTDSGLRGLVGVKFRRLTQNGHYAELKAKGSLKNRGSSAKLNASYNIPGANPSKDLHRITLEGEHLDETNYGTTQNAKLGYSYLTEVYGWQQTLGLRYQIERSNPADETTFFSNLLIPSVSWVYLNSDDPIKPNHGYKVAINARGASSALLSDVSFVQGWVSGKAISTLPTQTRLITRADLGMVGINNIEDLPLSLRFAAGGTQTIRGYGFNDIRDGRTLSIASIELQQKLWRDLYGAVFFDIGDIGPSFFSDVKRSAGVGLVWRSPVGAIALTLAQAIDKPGQPTRLELSMGPEL